MSQKRGFDVNQWLRFVGKSTLQLLGFLDTDGEAAFDSDQVKFIGRANNLNDPFVQESNPATLVNKSIDGNNNSFSNIPASAIAPSGGIDASRIADGSVSNTEFQYLDGTSGSIQVQLNSKQPNGNYITNLVGDVVANGPGNVTATIQPGVVDDSKISPTAAIQRSKIASDVPNYVIINDASGELSSEAHLALVRGGSSIDNSETDDSITTGTGAQLNAVTGHVRLTNSSLISLAMIPAPASGGVQFSLLNDTGTSITISNDSGVTPSNRIITGAGVDIALNSGSTLALVYDSGKSRWVVIGGTGSGSGSWNTYSVQTISNGGIVNSSVSQGFQVRRIVSSGGMITLSNTPFGAFSWIDGMVIRLVGQDNINTVSINNNDIANGVLLNGNCTLGNRDALELQYDASLNRWIEVERSN